MAVQVCVINQNGKPLMPCKPAKARHLLRDGKAQVAGHKPFTIQLKWDCEENVQDVTVSSSQFGWGSKKRDRHDHPAVLLDGPPEQRDEGMKLKMVGGHAMWTWAWNASDHPA